MRLAILSLVAGLALVFGPRVEAPSPTLSSAPIRTTVLPDDFSSAQLRAQISVAAFLATAADEATRYLAPPSTVTMPVLPDIPIPVSPPQPDSLPMVDAPPPLILQKVEPVRAAAKFVKPEFSRNQARITGNALNLRSGPGMRTAAIASLARGTQVHITASQRGKWVPVQVAATGQRGWVFHKFVERIR